MAQTKFGFNQIGATTPQWVKWTFRIFFYVTSVATIVLDIFSEIPADIKLVITGAVIKANLLVHALSKLFGVDPTTGEFHQ